MPRKVEISYRTIVFIVLFGVFLWFVFTIRSVLLGLFIALMIMSVLNPSVKKLESLKMPRWLAILIIYIFVLAIIIIAISGVVPPLIDQTSTLLENIPKFFLQFKVLGIDEKLIASQFSQFAAIPTNILKFLINVFSNLVNILGIAVITFYLLLERKNLDKYLTALFGEGSEKKIDEIIDKIEFRLGSWIRSELFLMIIVGVLNYLGFRLIGLEYALPLAIIAFLLEIVPTIGPVLAAFPAILIGLTISPFHGLVTAGWAFLVQQLENTVLVPRVMKTVAGVNPLVTIIALAIGFKLAGVGGAILAVPTYIAAEVIVSEIFSSKKSVG